jgi:hypothetical protein
LAFFSNERFQVMQQTVGNKGRTEELSVLKIQSLLDYLIDTPDDKDGVWPASHDYAEKENSRIPEDKKSSRNSFSHSLLLYLIF